MVGFREQPVVTGHARCRESADLVSPADGQESRRVQPRSRQHGGRTTPSGQNPQSGEKSLRAGEQPQTCVSVCSCLSFPYENIQTSACFLLRSQKWNQRVRDSELRFLLTSIQSRAEFVSSHEASNLCMLVQLKDAVCFSEACLVAPLSF